MKELSIEQKAKAYDEALEKSKRLYEQGTITESLAYIFPELKESEDEKIRKALIIFLDELSKLGKNTNFDKWKTSDCANWIAWLEKQGEQKVPVNDFKAKDWYVSKVDGKIHNIYHSVDKIESKFKVGDWVVDKNGTVQQILSYKDCIYKHTNGYSSKMFEDEWRLWDITKDAKDGDVLAFDNETMVIFKDLYNATTFHSYCHIEDGVFTASEKDVPDWWEGKGFQPATKEQRNLLFQIMRESGYEWDTEKKELKKIEQKPAEWYREDEQNLNACLGFIPDKFLRRWLKDVVHVKYDKSAWSEEDEEMLKIVIKSCEQCGNDYAYYWLKSLKQRVEGQ